MFPLKVLKAVQPKGPLQVSGSPTHFVVRKLSKNALFRSNSAKNGSYCAAIDGTCCLGGFLHNGVKLQSQFLLPTVFQPRPGLYQWKAFRRQSEKQTGSPGKMMATRMDTVHIVMMKANHMDQDTSCLQNDGTSNQALPSSNSKQLPRLVAPVQALDNFAKGPEGKGETTAAKRGTSQKRVCKTLRLKPSTCCKTRKGVEIKDQSLSRNLLLKSTKSSLHQSQKRLLAKCQTEARISKERARTKQRRAYNPIGLAIIGCSRCKGDRFGGSSSARKMAGLKSVRRSSLVTTLADGSLWWNTMQKLHAFWFFCCLFLAHVPYSLRSFCFSLVHFWESDLFFPNFRLLRLVTFSTTSCLPKK